VTGQLAPQNLAEHRLGHGFSRSVENSSSSLVVGPGRGE
jgi:hypothetical protein